MTNYLKKLWQSKETNYSMICCKIAKDLPVKPRFELSSL